MSEKRLNEELAAIEAALSGLTPSAQQRGTRPVDVFGGKSFGVESKSECRRLALAVRMAVSLLAAATFGTLWAAGGKREVVERVASVSTQSTPTELTFPSPRHLRGRTAGCAGWCWKRASTPCRRRAPRLPPTRSRSRSLAPIAVCSMNCSTTQQLDARRFS